MHLGAAPQTKEEIAHSVKEELTKSMSSFGFMIIQTLVTDIEPDMKVRAAMNEINAAQRMRCVTELLPGPTPCAQAGQGRCSAAHVLWPCEPSTPLLTHVQGGQEGAY